MEPEKCSEWTWSTWDDVHARRFSSVPLFTPLTDLFEQRPTFRPSFEPFAMYESRKYFGAP